MAVVLEPLSQEEMTMAERNGTDRPGLAQAILLDDPDFLRGVVERAVQAILDEEMTAHLGAARYERGEGRTGYRNGHKPRTLTTRVGTLELRVPQDRDGTFSTELFARYQRSEQALVTTLMEMYLQGVSTRKVAAIAEALCGTTFSKSQVSALVGRLDPELRAWRERPLTAAAYPYLVVDARYEHARVDGRVVSLGVLIVAGVRDDGRREILAVAEADTESEATYQDLFKRLKERGLRGVDLVTSDDHRGLTAAIARHFQGASWQRCQVHFARNLLGMVGARHRARLGEDLRGVFGAATLAQARAAARACASGRKASHPPVAAKLDDEIEACLACYAFPAAHRPRIRTTNGLERLNQELKRRTRVVRIFPNREAVERLVTALALEQSEEWVSGRRYLDMDPFWEGRRRPIAPAPIACAAD
jgi:transposase-like protein